MSRFKNYLILTQPDKTATNQLVDIYLKSTLNR